MTSAPVSTRAADLIGLTQLMKLSSGVPEVLVGLLDGPVALDHPDLASANIRAAPSAMGGNCSQDSSAACRHGTFVAGILGAKRGSSAPAICPGCTLLVRPVFKETVSSNGTVPSVSPSELARATIECVDAGTRVLNLSAAFAQPSTMGERPLEEALDYAARRKAIVVAAAGNQGALGSSAITRHPWVIPVVGCDLYGRPTGQSNLGSSVGKRGLMAPGEGITSRGADGEPVNSGAIAWRRRW